MKMLLLGVILLAGCSVSTSTPSVTLTCEQRFDRALTNGVPYVEALGAYTQCLVDRGDTVRTREAVSL